MYHPMGLRLRLRLLLLVLLFYKSKNGKERRDKQKTESSISWEIQKLKFEKINWIKKNVFEEEHMI